jgi:hypothetical protein
VDSIVWRAAAAPLKGTLHLDRTNVFSSAAEGADEQLLCRRRA